MPEERVSYLEPIDEEVLPAVVVPEKKQDGVIEKSVAPEFQSERKAEVKSESETTYQKILTSLPNTSTHDDSVDQDADQVSLKMDADSKVTQLVELAVTKGVVHAIKVARRLNDFYVLDQLHDDLANRLYQSLREKGLISE